MHIHIISSATDYNYSLVASVILILNKWFSLRGDFAFVDFLILILIFNNWWSKNLKFPTIASICFSLLLPATRNCIVNFASDKNYKLQKKRGVDTTFHQDCPCWLLKRISVCVVGEWPLSLLISSSFFSSSVCSLALPLLPAKFSNSNTWEREKSMTLAMCLCLCQMDWNAISSALLEN